MPISDNQHPQYQCRDKPYDEGGSDDARHAESLREEINPIMILRRILVPKSQ